MMGKMMLTMMPMMFEEIKGILAAQGRKLDMMEIMPKIMGPFMSGMLEVVPARQMQMMPGCMRRLMEKISYAEHILGILVEKGVEGLSDEEHSDYLAHLRAAVPSAH